MNKTIMRGYAYEFIVANELINASPHRIRFIT